MRAVRAHSALSCAALLFGGCFRSTTLDDAAIDAGVVDLGRLDLDASVDADGMTDAVDWRKRRRPSRRRG